MKLKKNWRNKTIEDLEKEKWSDPEFESFLVKRLHELRKIPIDNLNIEDLRFMIGQEMALNYLMPLAIETLTENLWAEGDFYEGDLLKNVLLVKPTFWNSNIDCWNAINNLIKNKRDQIVAMKIDLTSFDDIKRSNV